MQVDEVVYRKYINENIRGQRPGKQHHLRGKQWKKKAPRKGGEMMWQKGGKQLWSHTPKDDNLSKKE